LERALKIEALSPSWRASFEAMLQSQAAGNADLMPAQAAHPTAPGFRSLAIADIHEESADVLSLTMGARDGEPLPSALPGQYVVLRLQPQAGGSFLFRSYSLSGPSTAARYRISVKIEPNGLAGAYLRNHVHVDDVLDVSSPRDGFILRPANSPYCCL